MKPNLILKSLADIPANSLPIAASMPGLAVKASKQVLTPVVRITRRELRDARHDPAAVPHDIYARANAPFRHVTPWQRGRLNE